MVNIFDKGILSIIGITDVNIWFNYPLIHRQQRMTEHTLSSRHNLLDIPRFPLSLHYMHFTYVFEINTFHRGLRYTKNINQGTIDIFRRIKYTYDTHSLCIVNTSMYQCEYYFITGSLILLI